jgi:hypothetical protein
MSYKQAQTKIFLLTFLLAFSSYANAHAAKFFITNDITGKQVGDIVHATVYIDTEQDVINDGAATITFPTDKVEVESLSTSGSIFNLWVEQPAFSNQDGTSTFNGGIPNPGYAGSKGKVLQVTMKVVGGGTDALAFTDSSVLANDGLGTDVSKTPQASPFTLGTAPVTKPQPIIPVTLTSAPKTDTTTASLTTPVITSKDIPDGTVWYNKTTAQFAWAVPSAVETVYTSLDTDPHGVPTKRYSPPISTKKVIDLSDGKQYLHVRFTNGTSKSDVATYAFNVDTKAPKNVTLAQSTTPQGGTLLTFSAADETSGLAYYTLSIDGALLAKISSSDTSYLLPALIPGDHTINVTAFDKAGNSNTAKLALTSSDLKAPVITDYQKTFTENGRMTISGTTAYANATVRVFVASDNGDAAPHDVTSDATGLFAYTDTKIHAHTRIDAYAKVVLKDLTSPASQTVTLLSSTSEMPIGMLTLVFVLILAGLYICYIQVQLWRLRLEKNLDLSSIDIEHDLENLSIGIKDYVKILRLATKRQTMTRAEEIELLALFKGLSKSHASLARKLRRSKRA